MAAKFVVLIVDEKHDKLPSLNWLPKLQTRLIANSCSCTTTRRSIRLASCFTPIKYHVIKM